MTECVVSQIDKFADAALRASIGKAAGKIAMCFSWKAVVEGVYDRYETSSSLVILPSTTPDSYSARMAISALRSASRL